MIRRLVRLFRDEFGLVLLRVATKQIQKISIGHYNSSLCHVGAAFGSVGHPHWGTDGYSFPSFIGALLRFLSDALNLSDEWFPDEQRNFIRRRNVAIDSE